MLEIKNNLPLIKKIIINQIHHQMHHQMMVNLLEKILKIVKVKLIR
jgi:hypothetical protein